MKRNLVIAVAVLFLLAMVFSGCSAPKSAYVDGTYKASYDNFDGHGWKAFVDLTVKEGKISACTFDYINQDGKLKSQDEGYNTSMKAQSGTSPAEYSPKLAQSLVTAQDIAKVDSVSGATTSSNNFKALATAAVELAKKGSPAETTLPTPKE